MMRIVVLEGSGGSLRNLVLGQTINTALIVSSNKQSPYLVW